MLYIYKPAPIGGYVTLSIGVKSAQWRLWTNPITLAVQVIRYNDHHFSLTIEDVWVNTDHLRPTDIRKEFATRVEHLKVDNQIEPKSKAEELMLMLIN